MEEQCLFVEGKGNYQDTNDLLGEPEKKELVIDWGERQIQKREVIKTEVLMGEKPQGNCTIKYFF